MTQHIQNILTELKTGLSELYADRLERLMLYGSQARGDAKPDSDIDVLVVLKGEVNSWQEVLHSENVTADVSLQHGVFVSTIFVSAEDYRRDDESLFANVRREGIAF